MERSSSNPPSMFETEGLDGRGLLAVARQSVLYRNVQLAHILDVRGFEWLAVLAHAYFTEAGTEVHSLAELPLGDNRVEKLGELRKTVSLIEGVERVPPEVWSVLLDRSDSRLFLRRSGSRDVLECGVVELQRSLSTLEFGDEIEIASQTGRWYMRIKSDDPVAFIAGDSAVITALVSAAPFNALLVPNDFVFSY